MCLKTPPGHKRGVWQLKVGVLQDWHPHMVFPNIPGAMSPRCLFHSEALSALITCRGSLELGAVGWAREDQGTPPGAQAGEPSQGQVCTMLTDA